LLFVGATVTVTVTVTATAWRVRWAGELAFVLYRHLDVASGSPPCFLASSGGGKRDSTLKINPGVKLIVAVKISCHINDGRSLCNRKKG
jgi:hypothetical protein